MAGTAGRVIRLAVFVVAMPAACLGGLLMYGKALSEAEVAEGTLLSQEEIRARAEEARRIFDAMTPAQHLEAALEALDCGYDAATRTGGNTVLARRHLDAIPSTAPEFTRVEGLRAESDARAQRVLWLASWKLGQELRDHAAVSQLDEPARRQRREALAASLDQLSSRGVGCVHVGGGPERRTLRFDHERCTQTWVDTIVRPEHRDMLKDYGFVRVRCRNRQGHTDLVPDAGPLFPPRRGPHPH